MPLLLKELSGEIIGAAIAVHQELGPGLLESAYEECLCFELTERQVPYQRQVELPVRYRNHRLSCAYRLDLLVDRQVVVELKAVAKLEPIHEA